MELAWELVRQLVWASWQLVTQPAAYVAVLLLLLILMHRVWRERQLFHVRLRGWLPLVVLWIAGGIGAGIAISLVSAFIGVQVTPTAVYWLWGAALVLLLVRIRFFSFIYSIVLLILLQTVMSLLDLAGLNVAELAGPPWLQGLLEELLALELAPLLLLGGLLMIAESLLIRMQHKSWMTPLLIGSKRGKPVGGFFMQVYWLVPLALLVPAQESARSADAALLTWLPLLDNAAWDGGWQLLGLPLVAGFSVFTQTQLPGDKIRSLAGKMRLLGLLVALGGVGALLWSPLLPFIALLALGLREALDWWSRRVEMKAGPSFISDAEHLRILAVLPESPADVMALQTGEVLYKVNGKRVRTSEELYAALNESSALAKLELLTYEGQRKFAQRTRYAGDHHQLGIVLAPEPDKSYPALCPPNTLIKLLRRQRPVRLAPAPYRGSASAGAGSAINTRSSATSETGATSETSETGETSATTEK